MKLTTREKFLVHLSLKSCPNLKGIGSLFSQKPSQSAAGLNSSSECILLFLNRNNNHNRNQHTIW